MSLFVPLWDPPEGVHAGGYYRARRMLQHFKHFDCFVVKNDTFALGISAVSYPTRWLYAKPPILFQVMRGLNWLWSTIALCSIGLLSRSSIEAVYVPTSEILPASIAGWLVARIRRVPVVFCNLNVRDTEFWFVNRWFHRRVDAVITLSEGLADELLAQGVRAPIEIGTVGVDDLHVSRERHPEFEAVYVARHTEAKGIFELLEIWQEVVKTRPRARLLTIGSINSKTAKRIAEFIRNSNLGGNVTMLGSVSENDKWRAYSNANLCVFPSLVEGWGIVPIEAHLAGLPVIAYDLPAYQKTIASSPAALRIATGNRHAFARAILKWLENPPKAEVAQEWARTFTWEQAASREEFLLAEVLPLARRKISQQ